MSYTSEEIKILKEEKRLAYGCSLAVFSIGLLINLAYFIIPEFNLHWNWVLLLDLILFCIIIVIPYSMNRNYNRDLETERKTIVIEKVQKKETIASYHKGGLIKNEYYLTIHNYRHEVNEDFYNRVKKDNCVEIHYSKYSITTLGYKKCEEKTDR